MSTRNDRLTGEGRTDYRLPAQIDRDRVQYASAFARLAEVTQVVGPENGYVFHNRLTHSLKVAQLARRLAEKLIATGAPTLDALGGISPDSAEAAALAHDLGHPPFGHLAEEALNDLCKSHGLADGFEGNAQSFRIVTRLAVGDPLDLKGKSIGGLNLTRVTLNGILKYPWLHGQNPAKPNKWGAYDSEKDVFEWARQDWRNRPNVKSMEAELMDWADDITFSVHDLVDFYCAGQIPLDRLTSDAAGAAERDAFYDEVFDRNSDLRGRRSDLVHALEETLAMFPLNRRYVGSSEQRCSLWQFTTILISRYVDALEIAPNWETGPSVVVIRPNALDEIRMLKELTWHYVILHSDLARDQHGQKRMVCAVFNELLSAAKDKKQWKLFPSLYKEQLQAAESDHRVVVRVISDYIASMTERELVRTYQALGGGTCRCNEMKPPRKPGEAAVQTDHEFFREN